MAAYVGARDAFIAWEADSVLSISTNFRSCAPILTYVNERFQVLLSSDGQPGFTALDPFHTDRGDALCVAALDVAVADENGKASAERQRDAEAEAVAQMCDRLIGSEMIVDRRPTSEIKRAAIEEGMITLRQSGLAKVRAGVTTLREINKVTFVD